MPKAARLLILPSLSLLAFSACGPSVSVHAGSGTGDGGANATKTSESYSYSFEQNGCKTGNQVADSRVGYCQNLTNDEKNHYCAEWMRKDAFDKGCKGTGVRWESTTFDDDDRDPSLE
jgi:hypothetical protein